MQSFIIHEQQAPSPSAVVFDTPHSGTALPDHFRYACAPRDLMHMHDPHVENLLAEVPAAGVPVLEALVHRACIDLNRYEDEINPGMIEGDWPHPVRQTLYTAEKFSLFPAFAGPRMRRIAPIYNESARLSAAEAEYRIKAYHRPYYAALHSLLQRASAANGHAIHVDVHSFSRRKGSDIADIILGDGGDKGPLCDPCIKNSIRDHFKKVGLLVDFNGIYFSGGALVHSTGNPEAGLHSIQIEIARDLYMDQDTLAYHPGKGERMARLFSRLGETLKHLIPA